MHEGMSQEQISQCLSETAQSTEEKCFLVRSSTMIQRVCAKVPLTRNRLRSVDCWQTAPSESIAVRPLPTVAIMDIDTSQTTSELL